MERVNLTPIGSVRSPERETGRRSYDDVIAEVIINEDLVTGLHGLDGFSHVVVIFFMHGPVERDDKGKPLLKVHPERVQELPEVGVFATRAPHRPNRIGVTLCEIVAIEGNVMRVKGLDALDGSPVLDIKSPSMSYYRMSTEIRFPEWTRRLMEMRERGEL